MLFQDQVSESRLTQHTHGPLPLFEKSILSNQAYSPISMPPRCHPCALCVFPSSPRSPAHNSTAAKFVQQLGDAGLNVNQLLPLHQREFHLFAPILMGSLADQFPQIEIEVVEQFS